MAAGEIVGTWRLVSYERHIDGKGTRMPFGAHPRGYLIYSADGYMSAALMSERTSRWSAVPQDGLNPYRAVTWLPVQHMRRLVRFALSATRYISYSGRYSIDGNKVIHHVEVSLMPGLINTDQERTFELHGNRLVLMAEVAGERQQLSWERVLS